MYMDRVLVLFLWGALTDTAVQLIFKLLSSYLSNTVLVICCCSAICWMIPVAGHNDSVASPLSSGVTALTKAFSGLPSPTESQIVYLVLLLRLFTIQFCTVPHLVPCLPGQMEFLATFCTFHAGSHAPCLLFPKQYSPLRFFLLPCLADFCLLQPCFFGSAEPSHPRF